MRGVLITARNRIGCNRGEGAATTLTKGDRVYTLGVGIPSQAVPIFQKEGVTLLVGGGGGATAIDPDIQLPRVRTYWFDEAGDEG